MEKKMKYAIVIMAVSVFVLCLEAAAATVSLNPNTVYVQPGDNVQFIVSGSGFDNNADGGDFSVNWNADVLVFDDIIITNPPWDTQFINSDNADTGTIDSVFLGTSQFRGAGTNFEIATLMFDVVGSIGSSTAITLDNALVGWVAPGASPVDVTYEQSEVQVVPLPASVALLASALAGFAAIRRMRPLERSS